MLDKIFFKHNKSFVTINKEEFYYKLIDVINNQYVLSLKINNSTIFKLNDDNLYLTHKEPYKLFYDTIIKDIFINFDDFKEFYICRASQYKVNYICKTSNVTLTFSINLQKDK